MKTQTKPKKVKKAKKRNPTDATLRNINALKKRVSKLERQLTALIRKARL